MSRGLFPERDLYSALREQERGPLPASTVGGKAEPMETLGRLGGCWCGQVHNHDWPMKDQGAPHPRYPE